MKGEKIKLAKQKVTGLAKKHKRITKTLLILFVILAVLFVTHAVVEHERHLRIVKVSGNIEGDEVRISFRVTGKIMELFVDEGYVIRIGDRIALLNTDELSKIRNEAAAELKKAEYQRDLAKINYVRAENLFTAGAIPAQKRDEHQTRAEAMQAEVEYLRASLALAETRLGFTDLRSPLNGYTLVKSALAGEVVQEGATVFTAIDLNNIWVTAYINETDLGRVKLGQKAYIKTDTYKHKKYDGWVSFISQEAEFTPKYIQTQTERVKLVYRIKVRVDNSSLDLKPGMPADAYISVE